MKHLVLAGKDCVIYDNIDELPIRRFHRWQKVLMMAAGVGATLSDFDTHIDRVVRYLKASDTDNAVKELENLRQNVNVMQQEIPLTGMAFAALVKSIDGVACDDISEDGLQRTLDKLGDVTVKEMQDNVLASKKKIDHELTVYFPAIFDDVLTKQYYEDMKRRTLMLLEGIIEGGTDEEQIEALTNKLVLATAPQTWTGSKSVEVQQDKAFEDLCLAISKEFHVNAKDFSVMEYYAAQEVLNKIVKEREKRTKKR